MCSACVRCTSGPGVRYASSEQSESGGPEQFTAPYGIGIGAMAMWLQRYMHDYGATREDLFDVVGALRAHAQLNPYAYWHDKPLALDEYLSSRWVYEPMCLYDYDIPVTGAGAVILTTADRAAALPHKPAYVAGFVNTRERGDAIFEASGIGREAVQAAQLYDGFSPVVWVWLEALGFAGKGEAHEFTRERTHQARRGAAGDDLRRQPGRGASARHGARSRGALCR